MTTTHPYLARLSHWLGAIAIGVLALSGLQILRAFPLFGAKLPPSYEIPLPSSIGLGGWLGGALSWHFTFGWLLALASLFYGVDLVRGGWRRIWLSAAEWRGIAPMVRYYFWRGPKPDIQALYNPLQKFAYLSMAAVGALVIVTGAMLAQPVQLGVLQGIPGAWQALRVTHFACWLAMAAFVPGHLVMVAIAGRGALWAMIVGSHEESPAPAGLLSKAGD